MDVEATFRDLTPSKPELLQEAPELRSRQSTGPPYARLCHVSFPNVEPEIAEDYDANGVDRTLIRACQKESPLECLQMLEEMHQLAESVSAIGEPISSFD
jgi:hypothetical protein